MLPFIAACSFFSSIKNFLAGNIESTALSIVALLAIATIAPLLAWLSNTISKLGKPSEEVSMHIYTGKKFTFWIKHPHTKYSPWFLVLLYIIGWILITLIIVLGMRSGAISL